MNDVQVNLASHQGGPLAELFAEEVGLVIEVAESAELEVLSAYRDAGLQASSIGRTIAEPSIDISIDSQASISGGRS